MDEPLGKVSYTPHWTPLGVIPPALPAASNTTHLRVLLKTAGRYEGFLRLSTSVLGQMLCFTISFIMEEALRT